MSLIIFPADAASPADKVARKTFNIRRFSGAQIIAETITEAKVIKKFTGLVILMIAISFSFKSNSQLLKRITESYDKILLVKICLLKLIQNSKMEFTFAERITFR